MSPDTTSTCDNGTPNASAAIIPIVVLAPPPMSVTPTNRVYCSRESTRRIALLRPTAERNNMNDIPAPRLTGPTSDPAGERQRLVQSNCRAASRMHSSSE